MGKWCADLSFVPLTDIKRKEPFAAILNADFCAKAGDGDGE
jgi:hypothetical protein